MTLLLGDDVFSFKVSNGDVCSGTLYLFVTFR